MKRVAVAKSSIWGMGLLVLALPFLATPPAVASEVAEMIAGPSAVSFATKVAHDGSTLTVTGPGGFIFQERFSAGSEPLMSFFDGAGNVLVDGTYTWELVLSPALAPDVRATLAAARAAGDDSVAADLRNQGILPREPQVSSGAFSILGGALVNDAIQEEVGSKVAGANSGVLGNVAGDISGGNEGGPTGALKDFVIADDLIVDGSACIGFDCVNGENFGFDTIRLKENNLRIKFEDTSGGSFPSTDWQLTANASANGGLNKFSIDDITGNRTPFTIEGNAPTNSLYVDDGGRLGLGTSIPVVDIHAVSGNTPTLRLEQNGSSGFAPQTWDVAGNETSFFIRDASNGSTLPFRIRPGAPSQSLVIGTNGDVGIGTLTPSAPIHAIGPGGGAAFMMLLENDGRVRFDLVDDSADGQTLRFLAGDNGLDIVQGGLGEIVRYRSGGGANYSIGWELGTGSDRMTLANDGTLTTLGSVNPPSDRNLKENFTSIDPETVLEKLAAIEITQWNYKKDNGSVVHVGPMAQDFHAAFGLGHTDKSIATTDADGVALVAIQALNTKLEKELRAKDALIRKLEERLTALENQTP